MSAERSPINTEFLLSHADAEAEFLSCFKAGRLHHSWLIAGDRGIGKATLAYRIARYVFSRNGNGVLDGLKLDVYLDATAAYGGGDDDDSEEGLFEGGDYAPAPAGAPSSLASLDKSPLRLSRSHPVFARMEAGGISDFKVVAREYSDSAKTRLKSEITVDQVR
ncbi:MAG: hypothetical protein LBO78_02465, partial [Rickettsiales bacterium]|nr:hypothetical protein [Rickettsiales bacterium]